MAASEAQLYFDSECGPCALFAHTEEWAGRSRVRSLPLDGAEAAGDLADMTEAERFGYAHLVGPGPRRSGAEMMAPLVGLTLGRTGERVVYDVPAIDRALRWLYVRFWSYRRTRGCAAGRAAP
jgi:hypothetical protein